MEEKKFDVNSLIGFLLMGAILMWMMSRQPDVKKDQNKPADTEESTDTTAVSGTMQNTDKPVETQAPVVFSKTDSTAYAQAYNKYGSFAYSSTLPSAKEGAVSILENDKIKLTIANKGGEIVELLLKEYKTYNQKPLYLIKDGNAVFHMNFSTQTNRILNTGQFYFTPEITSGEKGKTLTMRLMAGEGKYLEYRYTLHDDDYLVDFRISSHGMNEIIDYAKPVEVIWNMKMFHTEKSVKYENMYTTLNYRHDEDEYDKLSPTKSDEKTVENVDWIAYKKQFFTSILKFMPAEKKVRLISENLVKDESKDTVFTKAFTAIIPVEPRGGEIQKDWQFFFGPSDYNLLKTYGDNHFEKSINIGWGIFGWINKFIIIPVFNLLKKIIPSYGLIIILMTIVIRIFMSPLVYKSYLSSAKMKVLRPEMEEINKKYPGKENAMKRQQETMELQRKAGVSVLSGCIPALLQMPVFFALFRFFPSNFDLRQKRFLWADDLSAYDNVLNLPFHIPIYGSHVSLFPLLASIAIFFYMRMSQSQQANMQPPAQEGMPDMQKMMKMMLYISPIMMLFFFNQYGSGLSLYYFVSNLLTLGIMYVIKEYVIDEDKVHAMVQKKKAEAPKKKSKFRQRLDEAMRQAQEQQELKQKQKKK
jgi:YidC/Oxa1 family membrane protein insertase